MEQKRTMPLKRSVPPSVHGVESPDYCSLAPEAGSNPNGSEAADTLSLPAPRTAFQDVILAKGLGKLDVTGLAHEITDQVAAKIAGQVRLDTFVDAVMSREGDALSNRIVEHILDQAVEGAFN